MITRSGRSVFPEEGCPSLYDIGWGLARIPRFAGQTKHWYSVLNHTWTIERFAGDLTYMERLAFALHDAPECIVSDTPSTWKTAETKDDERALLERILTEHGLALADYEAVEHKVKEYDWLFLSAEAEVLEHFEADHPHFFSQRSHPHYARAKNYVLANMGADMEGISPESCNVDAIAYEGHVRALLRAVREERMLANS